MFGIGSRVNVLYCKTHVSFSVCRAGSLLAALYFNFVGQWSHLFDQVVNGIASHSDGIVAQVSTGIRGCPVLV
jgi:hypothetical protein